MANSNRRNNGGLTALKVIGGIAAAGSVAALAGAAMGNRSANVTLPNQIDGLEVSKIIKNDPQTFAFLRGQDGKNGVDGVDGLDGQRILFRNGVLTGQPDPQHISIVDNDLFYVLNFNNKVSTDNTYSVPLRLGNPIGNHTLRFDPTKDYKVMFYIDQTVKNNLLFAIPVLTDLQNNEIKDGSNNRLEQLVTVDNIKKSVGSFFVIEVKQGVLTVVNSLSLPEPESHDVIVLPENNTQVVVITELTAKNVTIVLNNNSKFLADGLTPNHTLKVTQSVENIYFVVENNLFASTTWCIPKVVNDYDVIVDYYGSTTNSINRTWWESRYTGKTVRYKKYSNTSWGYIDSNTFTDILTRTASLVTADFQGTLMQNSIFAFTGSADLTVNLSTVKANLVKNRIYTIVNELSSTRQLTVNFGEIPFNYFTATSVIIKRMDGSVSISPEQTEFKGSLRFYINNASKFVVIP